MEEESFDALSFDTFYSRDRGLGKDAAMFLREDCRRNVDSTLAHVYIQSRYTSCVPLYKTKAVHQF
jgi:hypothetical protein